MKSEIPFPNCWWITDRLLAGPVFFAGPLEEVNEKMDALKAIGIEMIISLVGLNPFHPEEAEAEKIAWEIVPRFMWLGFDLSDGTAPDPETMKTILNWIDAGLRGESKVYLHCAGGCGRTATIAGCWLARHGFAEGEAALDYLDDLRVKADLPVGCPETLPQRERVTGWRKGK